MTINVETGEIDKECQLNRSYACSGCVNYYDEDDTVCKCGCIYYLRHFYPRKMEPTPRIYKESY